MNNKATTKNTAKNTQTNSISAKRRSPPDKRKFYSYSDIDKKIVNTEEYDDTQRLGKKEWDEEYQEFDEGDLGTDYGKP